MKRKYSSKAEKNRANYVQKLARCLEHGLCRYCEDRPPRDGKISCVECAEYYKQDNKRRIKAYRDAVFGYYGKECACCGETEAKFLTIDHINGGGTKHRKEIGNKHTYKWLIENEFPKGFQTLCMNCNFAKGMFGMCPHQDKQL